MTRKYLSIFLALVLPNLSFGFGNTAHQVIGNIAQSYLTIPAQKAIDTILDESLADASIWADQMRYKNKHSFWGYDYSANWHFVNIDKNSTYAQSTKAKNGNAYQALLTFIAVLQKQPLPEGPVKDGLLFYYGNIENPNTYRQLERLSLKFLIHLVADLHQPLHIGYLADRGGNEITVRWFGQRSNLHRVWDSQLLQAQDLNPYQLQGKLSHKINAMPITEASIIANATPLQWLNESLQLRDEIYQVQRYNSDFSQSYVKHFSPIIDTQLSRAALRLAELFNKIYSQ